MTEITRRRLLRAAVAAGVVAAVPAVATEAASQIGRLFAQIEQMKVNLDAYIDTFSRDDPAVDVAINEGVAAIDAVGMRMMAIEPLTAADLAMQVAFWQGENVDPDDDAGEHGASRDLVRSYIRRLAGLPDLPAAGPA